jgi:hypothetical protein
MKKKRQEGNKKERCTYASMGEGRKGKDVGKKELKEEERV